MARAICKNVVRNNRSEARLAAEKVIKGDHPLSNQSLYDQMHQHSMQNTVMTGPCYHLHYVSEI